MGRDKATLPFLSARLIDFMASLLAEAVVVENDSASLYQPPIVVSGEVPGFHCVKDRISGLGPLGGLYSVFSSLREQAEGSGALLVVPVDMPALSVASLRLLATQRSQFAPDSASALEAVSFKDQMMPLLLHLTPRVCGVLESLCLDASPRASHSVHEFCSLLRFKAIDVPEWANATEFSNLNTQEEWSQFT